MLSSSWEASSEFRFDLKVNVNNIASLASRFFLPSENKKDKKDNIELRARNRMEKIL